MRIASIWAMMKLTWGFGLYYQILYPLLILIPILSHVFDGWDSGIVSMILIWPIGWPIQAMLMRIDFGLIPHGRLVAFMQIALPIAFAFIPSVAYLVMPHRVSHSELAIYISLITGVLFLILMLAISGPFRRWLAVLALAGRGRVQPAGLFGVSRPLALPLPRRIRGAWTLTWSLIGDYGWGLLMGVIGSGVLGGCATMSSSILLSHGPSDIPPPIFAMVSKLNQLSAVLAFIIFSLLIFTHLGLRCVNRKSIQSLSNDVLRPMTRRAVIAGHGLARLFDCLVLFTFYFLTFIALNAMVGRFDQLLSLALDQLFYCSILLCLASWMFLVMPFMGAYSILFMIIPIIALFISICLSINTLYLPILNNGVHHPGLVGVLWVGASGILMLLLAWRAWCVIDLPVIAQRLTVRLRTTSI